MPILNKYARSSSPNLQLSYIDTVTFTFLDVSTYEMQEISDTFYPGQRNLSVRLLIHLPNQSNQMSNLTCLHMKEINHFNSDHYRTLKSNPECDIVTCFSSTFPSFPSRSNFTFPALAKHRKAHTIPLDIIPHLIQNLLQGLLSCNLYLHRDFWISIIKF